MLHNKFKWLCIAGFVFTLIGVGACKRKSTLQWIHINDACGKRWTYTQRWYYCGRLTNLKRWTVAAQRKAFLVMPVAVTGRAEKSASNILVSADATAKAFLEAHPTFGALLEQDDSWDAFTTDSSLSSVEFDLINDYLFELDVCAGTSTQEPNEFSVHVVMTDDVTTFFKVFLVRYDINQLTGVVVETILRDDFSVSFVPTVSEWGLIIMTLLLLTAGTVVLGRMRHRRFSSPA